MIAADEKEILDWINAVAGSREHNAETRERTIIEIMQNYIDEKGVAVQTSVGRIIVICGGNIMTNIQDTLAERTGKEVRVIDGSYVKPSAIAAAIGENDTVVIVVTHIGHNASGSATSICRSRGIPFVICRNTNAERIADRITALAA